MSDEEVQDRVRERFGLRVEPEMARYLLRQLSQGAALPSVTLIGGDARTGVPVQSTLDAHEIRAALQGEPSATSRA